MNIKKDNKILSYYKNILSLSKKFPLLMTFLVLTLIIQTAFYLSVPMLLKSLFDDALSGKDQYWFFVVVATLLFCFASLVISYVLVNFLSAKMGIAVVNKLRSDFYNKMQQLSISMLNSITINKLLSYFSKDIASVRRTTIFSLWNSISNLLFIPIGIGVLFCLSWQLTLIAVLLIATTILINQIFFKQAVKNITAKKIGDDKLLSFMQDDFAKQMTIRILRLFAVRSKLFATTMKEIESNDFRYYFLKALTKSIIAPGQMSIRLGILVIGSFLVLTGHLTMGVLIAFSVLLYSITACIDKFVDQIPTLLQASKGLTHIFDILHTEVDKTEDEKATLPNFSHHIYFNKVNYRYPNNQFTLHDIDLKIYIGQSVAIVGPSGSGKTTLVRLLLGQEIPTRGKVEIDMCDLKKYDLNSFHNQVGIVLQTNDLFNLSIADNIRMGKLDATNEEIIAAAKAAEIHDEIMVLKDSYDSVIGELDVDLSAGQCQRIAIARALIKNPAILVLDEVTAKLDSSDQAAINKTLTKLFKERTIIRITNDLSETVGMDKIFMLHEGRIISTGTHEELLQATSSPYANLKDKHKSLESV